MGTENGFLFQTSTIQRLIIKSNWTKDLLIKPHIITLIIRIMTFSFDNRLLRTEHVKQSAFLDLFFKSSHYEKSELLHFLTRNQVEWRNSSKHVNMKQCLNHWNNESNKSNQFQSTIIYLKFQTRQKENITLSIYICKHKITQKILRTISLTSP